MATQKGIIWAQWIAHHTVLNGVKTFTVYPENRDITAEAAIALVSPSITQHWSEAGISRIVSNGVEETFNPPRPTIKRSNVTAIQFRTAGSNSRVHGRYVIHYWT